MLFGIQWNEGLKVMNFVKSFCGFISFLSKLAEVNIKPTLSYKVVYNILNNISVSYAVIVLVCIYSVHLSFGFHVF